MPATFPHFANLQNDVEILSEGHIADIRRRDWHLGGDAIDDMMTMDAVEAGDAAVWCLHGYSHAAFKSWAGLINRQGKPHDAFTLCEKMARDLNVSYGSLLAAFCSRLIPANQGGANILMGVRAALELMEEVTT